MQPLSLTDESPHPINPQSGEGLIWESEVKVEVDEMQFEMLPTQGKGVNSVPDPGHEEDDKRILESHVEVKVDFDSYSGTGEEPSSPLFPSSATPSNSSSVETSPPSPTYRTKRYGFALPPGVTYDLDDADDDSDDYPEIYDWTSSPLFRGRSLTRKELTSFEIYGVSPNGSDASGKGKALSRLKSLRSISSNLRSSSIAKNDSKVVENDAAIADGPRTLFRGLRSRKSSPLVAQSVEVKGIVGSQCTGPYDNLEPKPTKKSGLKSWAKFIIPERRRNKRVAARELKTQARSCAPSPTGSWALTQEDHHEELPILSSKSETAFDTGSVASFIQENIEKGEALEATNLKTPDSPQLLAEAPAADHHRQSIEKEVHQDDSDEKTVNDITMPQSMPVVATVSTCGAEHVEEAREVAKSEINTAEDQPSVEADLPQKEATTNDPLATIPACEPKGLKEEETDLEESTASEQDADLSEASTESHGKTLVSPRSTFIQSIIESNDVRPHPPRKSSLRQMMSASRSASAIPKYSFPLQRIKSENTVLVEEESRLLSETASDCRH